MRDIELNTNRVLIVLGVLIMATSTLAMGAMAATTDPSIDTDTSSSSSTTTQSEINGSTTLANFTATDTGNHTVEVVVPNGSSAPTIELIVNASDRVTHTNSSPVNVSTNGPVQDGIHFNATFSNEVLADVPHQTNENVTVDLKVINASNSSSFAKVTFNLDTTDKRSVAVVNDSMVNNSEQADVVDATERSVAGFSLDDEHYTSVTLDERDINGSDTDVVVVIANDSAQDDWDDVVSEKEDGDRIWVSLTVADGQGVPLYYEEAPDHVDEADDTYATYEEDVGGEPAIIYHLGDDFDDEDNIEAETWNDVRTLGIGGLEGFNRLQNAYGLTAATEGRFGVGESLAAGGGFIVGMSLVVFGIPRRKREITTDNDGADRAEV